MSTEQGLAATLLVAALSQSLAASAETERSAEEKPAETVLHRYALAFTLHYLCGRNPLAQGVFGRIPATALSEQWVTDYSPALMELAGLINHDPTHRDAACAWDGIFADQYPVVELSESFLRGLRQLDRQGNALLAFENGTWFRLSGQQRDFEGYVRRLTARLGSSPSGPELAAQP